MGAVTAWGAAIPWGEEAVGAEGHCSLSPSLLSQQCLSLTFKFAGWGHFLGGGGCSWAPPEQFFLVSGAASYLGAATWEQQGSGTHWAVRRQCWQVFLFSTNTF